MDWNDLRLDHDFSEAVKKIIRRDCYIAKGEGSLDYLKCDQM